jgi:hypothetical protein
MRLPGRLASGHGIADGIWEKIWENPNISSGLIMKGNRAYT